jgi:hypothetical protein
VIAARKSNGSSTMCVLYNLGLVLFDMKLYEDAKARAVAAYELGYPLPGLRRKLERIGKW